MGQVNAHPGISVLTVTGDGAQTRSIQYVDDLVEGIWQLLNSDHPGPLNIGNPHEVSVRDLTELIRDLTDSDSPITLIPRPQDDPAVRRPDISLARRVLGWQPQVPLVDGLKHTIKYIQALTSIPPQTSPPE